MEHPYIDEQQIAERYLLGQLGEDEARRFEEHYLHCAECLDRLAAAEGLQRGLRRVAEEEVARVAVVRAGAFAALSRFLGSRQAPLALTLLLVVALLPAGLLLWRVSRLEQTLASRPAVPAPVRTPAPAVPGVDPRLEAQLEEARGESRRLAGELNAERRRREEVAGELSRAREPQVNVPVLSLAPERSGPGEGEPTHRIALGPLGSPPRWILLSLELDGPEYPRYRAALAGSDGRVLWRGDSLRPDATGSLTLSLHSSLLRSGDFAVRVEGMPAAGPPVPVASFPFRVTP
jgi:hypothetical protein